MNTLISESTFATIEETLLGGTTARRGDIVMARGEGCWLWDVDGNRYLDLGAAQAAEEPGGVIDVQRRVEHGAHGFELVAMIVVVDLHAADVDQLHALRRRGPEDAQRLGQRLGEYRLACDVHGVRLQRAALAALGQADRIEDADRHAMAHRGLGHLAFADARMAGPGDEQAR